MVTQPAAVKNCIIINEKTLSCPQITRIPTDLDNRPRLLICVNLWTIYYPSPFEAGRAKIDEQCTVETYWVS